MMQMARHQDLMIPRNDVIAALEEPACEMADNADIALDYISGILADLELKGHLCRHKVNAATRILAGVVDAATRLRDSTYKLMETPVTEMPGQPDSVLSGSQPADLLRSVKALSEELRIDWALSTMAERDGSDEEIEIRQRDRVHRAMKALEELFAH